LLVHPAIEENTGTAIVEALVANLPVIATANCGYAFHVEHAGAGIVIADPYEQAQFNRSLRQSLEDPALRERWRANAQRYVERTDMFSRPQRAVELIEQIGAQRMASGGGDIGQIESESCGANRS
jgi:UDP-glucose:(heptosyl)LPS alpha-1,3-glucosyltransferase